MSTKRFQAAVAAIIAHPGFMSVEGFQQKYLNSNTPDAMSTLIKGNGCLITLRHDFKDKLGQDFLLNLFVEMVVLHINPTGKVSLHQWEKAQECTQNNRLTLEKEKRLLDMISGKLADISDKDSEAEFEDGGLTWN